MEQASVYKYYGLTTVVLNHQTTSEARSRGVNLWQEAVERKAAMLLMSPEMMNTDGYESYIWESSVRPRLRGFGVDETHLCLSWGKRFRGAFKDLGFNRDRIPSNVPLILTTATLATGKPTNDILSIFNLRHGQYHLIRRSNARPELQLLFLNLKAGVSGITFPDLDWVLQKQHKTIIFCSTVKQANSLVTYLRNRSPKSSLLDPKRRIRHYNAVNFSDHNAEILKAFREDSGTQIIVATDALMVGIDLPNVEDVIVLLPKQLDEVLQKIGRAGRDHQVVKNARGIIYISQKAARDAIELARGRTAKDGDSEDSMDEGLALVIVATCKVTAINSFYNNPLHDTPCSCPSCQTRVQDRPLDMESCNCSGCQVEDLTPVQPTQRRQQPTNQADPIPKQLRLTKKQQAWGMEHLRRFRTQLYMKLTETEAILYPSYAYLPDPLIHTILDRYATITDLNTLSVIIGGHSLIRNHTGALFEELCGMKEGLEVVQKATKGAKRRNDVIDESNDESAEEGTQPVGEPSDEHNVSQVQAQTDLPSVSPNQK